MVLWGVVFRGIALWVAVAPETLPRPLKYLTDDEPIVLKEVG